MRRFALRRGPAGYDERFMQTMADEYLKRTPWTELRLAAVFDLVEPAPGERVLDLGCAAGAMTHFLSTFGCDVTGIDFEPLAIERARTLFPGLRFEQADATDLPYDAGSFDKAVAADLVEHLDDRAVRAMLSETHRVLRPGGTLSIYTPNRRHLIERLKAHDLVLAQNPTHIAVRDADELAAAIVRAGFELGAKRVATELLSGPSGGRARPRPAARALPVPPLPARAEGRAGVTGPCYRRRVA